MAAGGGAAPRHANEGRGSLVCTLMCGTRGGGASGGPLHKEPRGRGRRHANELHMHEGCPPRGPATPLCLRREGGGGPRVSPLRPRQTGGN